jgi:hypothetical protein
MAMDHNASGRRPHYHRGRRGTDRRGNERRTPPPAPDQGARASGDQTDVEQIMRDIRARISQRSGIELSNEQIQELAARRLEAILDPRTINPTLLDQLRKGAAAVPDALPKSADAEHSIADDAIYEGGALLQFFRRLLNPLLKLLFNPAPLVAALQAQGRANRDAAARALELERRQTEWNALHYQILQRLVTEVSRTSIEMQSLSLRVEALSARVDFNDRRVRTLETIPAAPTRSPRQQEVVTVAPAPPAASSPIATSESATTPAAAAPAAAQTTDGPKRRRRRRRGRRGSLPAMDSSGSPAAATVETPEDASDVDEGDDEETLEMPAATEPMSEDLAAGPAPSTNPDLPAEPPSPEQPVLLTAPPAVESVTPPEPSALMTAPPGEPAPAEEPAPATSVPPANPGTPEH